MSRVFVSPLATPFHLLVSIFPIPSRYISIFHAPSPRYFSPSLSQEADGQWRCAVDNSYGTDLLASVAASAEASR